MAVPFALLLVVIGASVGFLSGMLGIGGGIVMFPLLMYLPAAFGFAPIGVKEITGLTMAQGFFASLSAMILYHRQRLINRTLVLTLGVSLFSSSLLGSLASKLVSDRFLLLLFGLLALVASVMMLLPRTYGRDDLREDEVTFTRTTAILIGLIVGFCTGLVGQGGAFIIIPLMLYVLRIPLRVALGSTLAIGLFSSTAGLSGKVITGQVPFLMAAFLIAGAIPAAQLGGLAGKRTKAPYLRWLLALLITATAIKVLADIL